MRWAVLLALAILGRRPAPTKPTTARGCLGFILLALAGIALAYLLT